MQWVCVSGSWRKSSPELDLDLVREVTAVLEKGDGIVTGGALNVDYKATDLALNFAPDGCRLKVILPTSLEIYTAHYRKRATEGVITPEQAEDLIAQLGRVQKLGCLTALPYTKVDEETYYLRNTAEVEISDKVLAFQVNQSAGAGDTVRKAEEKGIPVQVFSYTVE